MPASESDYWQAILPAEAEAEAEAEVDAETDIDIATGLDDSRRYRYPARFDDGRILMLPLRPLPDGKRALASLIINQASFAVVDALAADLAQKLLPFAPEVVIGLPTLGLTLASAVAQELGLSRYVPLGNSAKFWYRRDLSVPLSSVTTPDQDKRLYIDPRMLPLLPGRRVALIDDVISSGTSMLAALDLLQRCGIKPAVLGAAMLQSDAWQQALAGWPIAAVLKSPVIRLG
jgi:adenine/guanine phosphoribosyltransferase-like PRPP-binding protein